MLSKIIAIISINLILLPIISLNVFTKEKVEKYFMVTAYYSPTPNQKYFSTGNYADEIRLNGGGVVGASGKPVFEGMLAGPKEYAFGTKIDFEGIGIGSIEDRGGGIISAGSGSLTNDRIDIWVGFGDKGLHRAMYWGKRKVKGTIISNDSEITIDLDNFPIKKEIKQVEIINNTGSYSRGEIIKESKSEIIAQKLNFDFNSSLSTLEQKKELQNILTKLGYYKEEINGNNKSIEKAILSYQLSKKIISSKNDIGAGVFGPKTKEILKKDYLSYIENKEIKQKLLVKINEFSDESYKKASERMEKIGHLKFGVASSGVRELQNTLKQIGYFNYKDTAIFGETTKQSLISYQLSKKIISSKNDIGAGSFGEKTKETLKQDLKIMFISDFIKKDKLASSIDKVMLEKLIKDV